MGDSKMAEGVATNIILHPLPSSSPSQLKPNGNKAATVVNMESIQPKAAAGIETEMRKTTNDDGNQTNNKNAAAFKEALNAPSRKGKKRKKKTRRPKTAPISQRPCNAYLSK